MWDLPVLRCAELASDTALVTDWTSFDIWNRRRLTDRRVVGRGGRSDQNVTGYRADEDFGFSAGRPVRTGRLGKITGIG
jgi:hypothetical protein